MKDKLTSNGKAIYGLVEADTLELRYIGQTNNAPFRVKGHLRQYPNLRLIVLERDPPDGLRVAEKRWIRLAKQGGARLLNRNNGGAGPPPGRVKTPEHRAKIAAALMGHQGTHTAKTKSKISATMKGRPLSPEHSKKIAQSQIGRICSAETRARISRSVRAHYEVTRC